MALVLLAFAAQGLSGCTTVRYLLQAGKGQLAMANRARPIREVLMDERTPARIRTLLGEIAPVKAFGERNGLKPTGNYEDYLSLDRSAAVWVVSACESLRFKSKEWSFPFFGSFPFLGWFDLADAKTFADEVSREGDWDVDVRGARAYSTLGWFRDAVLSTMIPEGPEALGDLVEVVLHESVHATLYLSSQSYFNESLASFVAEKLTPVYLEEAHGAQAAELQAYLRNEEEGEKRQKQFHEAYVRLEAIYSSSAPDGQRRAEKKKVLDELKAKLGYKRDLNNAALVQFRTYNVGRAEFEAIFESCGRDWTRFWSVLMPLKSEAFKSGNQEDLTPVLAPLARAGCKPAA